MRPAGGLHAAPGPAACQRPIGFSILQDKYVKNIEKVVKVNDVVRVRVMSVDAGTGRIALTMKGMAASAEAGG